MTRTILDPTGERSVGTRECVGRPASLRGLTVGLLDISKPRGQVFLDDQTGNPPADNDNEGTQ